MLASPFYLHEFLMQNSVQIHCKVLYFHYALHNSLTDVHSTSFVTDTGENVVDIVFLCEYESGEAFSKSPDEVEKVS